MTGLNGGGKERLISGCDLDPVAEEGELESDVQLKCVFRLLLNDVPWVTGWSLKARPNNDGNDVKVGFLPISETEYNVTVGLWNSAQVSRDSAKV